MKINGKAKTIPKKNLRKYHVKFVKIKIKANVIILNLHAGSKTKMTK